MPDNDNAPYDFLGRVVKVEFEFNEQLRGLIDVAKVAVGPAMPQANASEALLVTRALLALIDRTISPELQLQDPRIAAARRLEASLVSLLSPPR